LFKKAAVFTDIHLGLKGNSKVHNDDCEEFVDWFIQNAKDNGCETGIFCGDWHHNRNSLNLTTMDATIRSMEKLGASFEQFFFFDGNHDLYYKDKRDVNSTAFAKHIPGITFIDKITTKEDVTLVPWLVGEEWKKIKNIKSKYMFGHFELPSFYMNAMVQMPDTGELQASHFEHQEYVFSGHFHKRQKQGKIYYIGNAFPHNYADAWDDNRGMMILDKENNKDDYVNIIDEENKRLASQVERVLNIARTEKESYNLDRYQVNIHDIINESVNIFNFKVEKKEGKIIKKLNADNPFIKGNKDHLINVFNNLIENAYKYSEEKPIIIGFSSEYL